MDLHDLYEDMVREAWVRRDDVTTLRVGDERVHHCGCGYETDLIEVMAIHQVRVHNAPGERRYPDGLWPPAPLPPKMIVQGIDCVEYWEADNPNGPWARCPDGIIRKRYGSFKAKPQ